MRRLLLTVAFIGCTAFVGQAQAQSVFVPQDDQPAAVTPSVPLQPAPAVTAPAPVPFSQPNTVGATRSVAPSMAQRGVTSGTVPVVRGMTPEQIAHARQSFESLAAKNPQIAAVNPFARMEALQAVKEVRKQISKRVRETCKINFFNVLISNDLAQNQVAFNNVKGYGANTVVSAMGNLCGDSKLKKTMEESVGVFNIRHKAGLVDPKIEGGVMMLTFSYDFTLPEPPKMPIVNQQLKKALEFSGDANVAAYTSYREIDQDEMDSRMERMLGDR